jgi:hypothetical protein
MNAQTKYVCDLIRKFVALAGGSANGKSARHRKARPLKPG